MGKQKSGTITGILLPMGLVCLFAFCSLALALMGGRAYRQIQGGMEDSFGTTVAASYLRTKLSSADGEIQLRPVEGGGQLLVICTRQNEVDYETRIWFADGRLMEVFERASTPFEGSGGMKVADLSACAFALEDGLLTAELTSPAGTLTRTACALPEGGAA